jgi:serine/threonine protein kinase
MNEDQTVVQPTRVTKKISDDVPPEIPFLHFDRIVGRGGMAVVWRAWHQELNKFVAVKVLDKDFALTGKDLLLPSHAAMACRSSMHPHRGEISSIRFPWRVRTSRMVRERMLKGKSSGAEWEACISSSVAL